MTTSLDTALQTSRTTVAGADTLNVLLAAEERIAAMDDRELVELTSQLGARPRDPFLNLWVGLALAARGRHATAIESYVRAIELGCTHWRVGWYLALAARGAGQIEVVDQACAAVLKASPEFWFARELPKHARGYYAQMDQDQRIEAFFATRPARTKRFVEVGAFDGVHYSNVRRLVERHGWSGVSIEPVTANFRKLAASYAGHPVQCVQACISDREGTTDLHVATYPHLPSWGCDVASISGADRERWQQSYGAVWTTETVATRRLTNLLEDLNIPQIDLLSVDAEGHDLEVLRSLDLNRFAPLLIVVEYGRQRDEILRHLANWGYQVIHDNEQDLFLELSRTAPRPADPHRLRPPAHLPAEDSMLLEDHLLTGAALDQALERLNPHLRQLGTLPIDRPVRRIVCDPRQLVTVSRFDLMAKLIYARHRVRGIDCAWATELYREHIRAFSEGSFREGDGRKHSFEDYRRAFHDVLDTVGARGFDPTESLVPLGADWIAVDGAHRIAAALAHATPVHALQFAFESNRYDSAFFAARGLGQEWRDAMAHEFCRLRADTHLALVFPAATGRRQEILRLLATAGEVVHEKHVVLNRQGAFNLLRQVYAGEAWIGAWADRFAGVWGKVDPCFAGDGPLRVFVFTCADPERLRQVKARIRDLFGLGNHSIHIDDTHAQALAMAGTLLNDTSIHFLNHARLEKCERFERHLERFRAWLDTSGQDPERFCVDGSAVLAAYGLRDAQDLDVLHFGPADFAALSPEINSHNEELHHHVDRRDDILFNPGRHFYYRGVKFASLDVMRRMKARRDEGKDRRDVAAIDALLAEAAPARPAVTTPSAAAPRPPAAKLAPAAPALAPVASLATAEPPAIHAESRRPARIVGLVPARNEAARLPFCLRALARFTDAIVYLDDFSDDDSVAVVESLAAECRVERILRKQSWHRDEPGDRNALLEAGRALGGTHFLVIDADEAFTANCADNNYLRQLVLALEPGDQIAMTWIQLWRGLDRYRFDDSVWTWNTKGFAFCDDGLCRYRSEFIHTSRVPDDLKGRRHTLPGYAHGLLHFQFVHWRSLLVKQAWYRCLERLREPGKSASAINERYAPSKDESGLRVCRAPREWLAGYAGLLDPAALVAGDTWRERQVLAWFTEHGRERFADLDIWDVAWGSPDQTLPAMSQRAWWTDDQVQVEGNARLTAHLQVANSAFARRDYAKAIEELSKAAGYAPGAIDITLALGNVLSLQGDHASALWQLTRATLEHPTIAAAWLLKGAAALQLGRPAIASAAAAEALRLEPDAIEALRLAANVALARGCFAEAGRHLTQLLEHVPNDIEALLSLGTCFHGAGDTPSARMVFERVLELDPRHPLARQHLASLDRQAQTPAPKPAPKPTTQGRTTPPATRVTCADALPGSTPASQAPSHANAPLITALVSACNSEKYLRGCLEDLLAQTIAPQLEIVVIDSGSDQNERAIVEDLQRRHPHIVYLRTERETVYGAWNRGIAVARGRYLTNANTDDRHHPEALQRLVAALESQPAADVAYADCWVTQTENAAFGAAPLTGRFHWPDFDRRRLFEVCYIGPQPVWRRSLHERFGVFDASLQSAGDYEFWLRICSHARFLHIAEPLGLYLESESSIEHRLAAVATREAEQARQRHWPAQAGPRPPVRGNFLERFDPPRLPDAGTPHSSRSAGHGQPAHPDLNPNAPLREHSQPALVATIPPAPVARDQAGANAHATGPTVSVIIPTHNRPVTLVAAVKSVLEQTLQDFEILVINDGGDPIDHLLRDLDPAGRITCVRHGHNRERSAARNSGLRLARGRYIAYLDDDDRYLPRHLETLVQALRESGGAVAYSDAARVLQVPDPSSQEPWCPGYRIDGREIIHSQDFDAAALLVGNYIPILCLMHERSCLEKTGLFDEDLGTHEDWDLWIRLSRHFQFRHVPQVTAEYAWRLDGTTTSSRQGMDFLETFTAIHQRYETFARQDSRILERQAAARAALRGRLQANGNQVPHTAAVAVSIVIPVFNKLELTRACLDGIRATTPPDLCEIIVVDNASTDGTAEFLRREHEAGRLTALCNEENLGFARATNQGIRIARGSFVLFLNNDTVPQAGWLDALLEEAATDPKLGLIGARLLYPGGELIQHAGVALADADGRLHPYHAHRLRPLRHTPEAFQSRDCRVVTAACLLVRREVFETVGFLDEDYVNGFEDVDFCLRAGQAGFRVRYCASSVVIHHESMTPGRHRHERENYRRLNDTWHGRVTGEISPAALRRDMSEMLCRERTLRQPARAEAWSALLSACLANGRDSEAAEIRARLVELRKTAGADPTVSIVIPTFNNLELTKKCLDGIEAASGGTNYEIVVVDNASMDGTVEYLAEAERTGRLRAVYNPANVGFARACNQGARHARGTSLVFLNNDTVPTTGWLDPLVNTLREPGVGAVGAKLLYPDGRIQHAGIEFVGEIPDHVHRHAKADAPEVCARRELDMVTGACLALPRTLFLDLGGFDEVYRNGVEDIDLCLRVRAAGRRVLYEPASVVYHHEGQSQGRFDHVNDNLRRFMDRWRGQFDSARRFHAGTTPRIFRSDRSVLFEKTPVDWEGSFLDLGSLSLVNRRLVEALDNHPGLTTRCLGRNALPEDLKCHEELRRFAARLAPQPSGKSAVTVRHAWPPRWTPPARGAWVVIQPWEFGTLPRDWVAGLQQVDQVWVPSSHVRDVYLEAGVPPQKVRVVPNGIDPEQFRPDAPPMTLATRKRFKFLFVGGTIARKGPDVLLKSYLESFTAADDVCLVIKDFGGRGVYAGQTMQERIRQAQHRPNAPEILYLDQEVPAEAMAGLYTACDCLVHPYRGEGFGLPVLEAMACGLPVVVTGGGATDDFATDEFARRIRSRRVEIADEVGGLKLAGKGWWLEPDAGHLSALMREAYAAPGVARALGRLASDHVRTHWTWARSARTAAALLADLAQPTINGARKTAREVKPGAKGTPLILPPVALLGDLRPAQQWLEKKRFAEAWEASLEAIEARPFHPEAWLTLARIALTAGEPATAQRCAETARQLAPDWKEAARVAGKAKSASKAARPSRFRTPPAPRFDTPQLTVCMIVRNEERFLGRCLASVQDLASQIVVVDTGSTDRTVEIARSFGAEVVNLVWQDDFSRARNAALERARGDWVLVLDADEELLPEGRERLRQDIRQAGVIAYRLPLVDVGREAEGCSYIPRLFRNAPGLFYVSRVHEQVFSSVEVRRRQWSMENRLGTPVILHHGYQDEIVRSRDKINRNLKLLEQALLEMPDEPNLLMSYGLELVRVGRGAAGLEKYRRAFERLSETPREDIAPELRETLLTQMSTHLMGARLFTQIVELLESPLAKQAPLTATLHFHLGLAFLELQRWDACASQMRACLAKRRQPALSPINREIHKAGPNHCLAVALWKLERHAEARKAFDAALADDPQSTRVQLDFARFLANRSDWLAALGQLTALAAIDPHIEAAWVLGAQIGLENPTFHSFALDWTGEAVRHLPESRKLRVLRAETLMLADDAAAALEAWSSPATTHDAKSLAGKILCEAVTGHVSALRLPPREEQQVSQACIEWVKRWTARGCNQSVAGLEQHLDELGTALPSAARALRAVFANANVEVVS